MVTTRSGAKLGAASRPDKRKARAGKPPSSHTDSGPYVPRQEATEEVTATVAGSEFDPPRGVGSENHDGHHDTNGTLEPAAVEESRLELEGEPDLASQPSVEELSRRAVAVMKKHLSVTSGRKRRHKKQRSAGSEGEEGGKQAGSSREGGRLPDYVVLDNEAMATSSKKASEKRTLKSSSRGYYTYYIRTY